MNEEDLRESPMAYPLKANLYIRGVAFMPCNDCPFKNERPSLLIDETVDRCFQECPHNIIVWILNQEQLEKYEELRPLELKEKDLKFAIKMEKIPQEEEFIGAPEIAVTPVFFKSQKIASRGDFKECFHF